MVEGECPLPRDTTRTHPDAAVARPGGGAAQGRHAGRHGGATGATQGPRTANPLEGGFAVRRPWGRPARRASGRCSRGSASQPASSAPA